MTVNSDPMAGDLAHLQQVTKRFEVVLKDPYEFMLDF
jgi:hypothetical protein